MGLFNEMNFLDVSASTFLRSGLHLSYVRENKLLDIRFSIPALVRTSPICFRLFDGNERSFRTEDLRCLHVCCVRVEERKSITCGRILKVRHYYRSMGRSYARNECTCRSGLSQLNLKRELSDVFECHSRRQCSENVTCNEMCVTCISKQKSAKI